MRYKQRIARQKEVCRCIQLQALHVLDQLIQFRLGLSIFVLCLLRWVHMS